MPIEGIFKTSKEYLDLLPLSKWTDDTVRGKILHDIINTIGLLFLRKKLKESGYSISEIFGRCQSLMCCRRPNGDVLIETANKQVKNYYKLIDVDVPTRIKTGQYIEVLMKAVV